MIKKLIIYVLDLIFAVIIVPVSILQRKSRRSLIWGPVPVLNYKYWSQAMKEAGWNSETLVYGYYDTINVVSDFDIYYGDLYKWIKLGRIRRVLEPWLAFYYVIKNARILFFAFNGGPLGGTLFWRIESYIYKIARIKTVILPYGGDIFMYSRIVDASIRNSLLLSYPRQGRYEDAIRKRVKYWTEKADVVVMGFTLDGIGRWDVPVGNMLSIDNNKWNAGTGEHNAKKRNSTVKIVHAPNHRGVKGTEYIVDAVERLKSEGLDIELILIEKCKNDSLMEILSNADILADQLLLPGYGLAAVEGMALGLPVIANLENEEYTAIFRRYSFLDECPIVSATPETISNVLRALSRSSGLREELGQAGIKYVEKYHSYKSAQYLFESIIKHIEGRKDIDLMNLFHPLRSEYNKTMPKIRHPLERNKLPKSRLISGEP